MDTFYLRNVLLNILRSDDGLVRFSDQDGFVPEEIVLSALKYHINNPEFPVELFTQLLDESGRYIERTSNSSTPSTHFVRATYGHKGHMLMRINWGKYVPYQGHYKVFCISHITRNGLGVINFNRKFNILNTPERCENKGVKGFIDIQEARMRGLEFWSQVGDRYGNKIFCFDTNLNECFSKYEYIPDYTSSERIMGLQSNYVDLVKRMCGFDEKGAIGHIQALMLNEADYEDDVEEKLSDYDGTESVDLGKLSL
jgi:hypothetical protein